MSNADPSSPLPPAPPSSFRAKGCWKFGLIGCGTLILLAVLASVAMMFWARRNAPELEAGGSVAAREGARFGLRADEAGCFAEGKRRANEASGFSKAFAAGGFTRSCLEFSRPTEGFCANVPPPTAIRRSLAWQRERCSGDTGCSAIIGLMQNYCAEGQPKRVAADTMLFADSTGAAGRIPGDTAARDSMVVGAETDSSSF